MALLQSDGYKKNLLEFRPTGPSLGSGYEPNDSQRQEVFENQGDKAIGSSSKDKKALAWRFYELRREILKDAQSLV